MSLRSIQPVSLIPRICVPDHRKSGTVYNAAFKYVMICETFCINTYIHMNTEYIGEES